MTDNQKSTAKPLIYILVVGVIIAGLIIISNNAHVVKVVNIENPKKEVFKKKKTVVFKKAAKETNVEEVIATAEKKAKVKKVKKKKKASSKKTISDTEYFNMVKAEYQKNVYSLLERPKDRTDLVIRYYKKDMDGKEVYSLKALGLYIHERPSDIVYNNMSSNALFYGDSISRRDIEIIAYTLIKSGFNLKVIAPSLYSKTWKNYSLEIGTDSTFIDKPNLKYSDIRKVWGKKP